MSKSILESLYHGKISPYSRPAVSTPERKELAKRIQAEKEYFTGKMSPDDIRRFDNLEDLLSADFHNENADIFSNGFSLGALLMLEIMER
jgi:hypothetical protein